VTNGDKARIDLSASVFERLHQELLASVENRRENDACVECSGCIACQGSTFCKDSERLSRCHYCVRCELCSESSHCRDCRLVVACHHCIDCENCTRSSYLVRSVSVSDSNYCFGCVGLSGKDFHSLNEPYDRTTYFEITRRLVRELGLAER
jgi:hypothetical protein